jgi:hypothetical protein
MRMPNTSQIPAAQAGEAQRQMAQETRLPSQDRVVIEASKGFKWSATGTSAAGYIPHTPWPAAQGVQYRTS